MKAVVQKDLMGCGLACVAAAADKPYDHVRRIAGKSFASARGYYCKELVSALKRLGLKYSYEKLTQKNRHWLRKDGVIVFIARSKKYPAGHYLLRIKKGWMNPWINFPVIAPAKAGFQKKLPGKAQWIILPMER